MWVELQFLRAEFDSPERQLLGLSDMETVSISGRNYLLAAGAADAGLSSYEILNDGSLVASDDVLWSTSSGTEAVSDLSVFTIGASTYLLPTGKADDNQTIYEIGADGGFAVANTYVDAASTYAKWEIATVVEAGGNSYLYGSIWGQGGFFRFDLQAGGALSNPFLQNDTIGMYLGDVSAIESGVLHGKTFVFVASALDAGFHSFEIGVGGALNLLDTVAAPDIGFSGITAMAAVDVGARAFVIVASAGTDSLLVMRVSEWGTMKLVDRLVDTNDTRFAGVSALEVFEADGRYFLLAGGADDGITLFEVTYKGQLDILATVADTADMTLQNVTDIEATVIGSTVNIFVSSATDQGFTQFSMNIPNGSNIIRGGAVVDILTGTAQSDTIFGHGRNDELRGMGGDDRLIDGRGNDKLWGGAGADVFEFVADGRKDYIMDYEIGVDKIDLRDAAMLYYYQDITFTPTADGAMLAYGDDQLVLTTMDATSLTIDMFTQDDFIFG
ncbi:MAG: hypothetical protein COA53_04585 [Rhodobacteraceae bacterium]|nr:MAG: hypothetical protein COA53_04585 [Paracoccaceae bacterium]